jgi:hypothetical protein
MMQTFEVDVGGRTYEVDAPDEGTAWKWANVAHKEAGAKREAAIKQDQDATAAARRQDEASRGFGERALINLGAGFDTAWQGAKQLGAKVGLGGGVSDEELTESRRLKQEAAEGTTGGSLIQLAGEVAPTLAIPMGAAGSLGRAALMGAGGGAAAGALQPVLTSESRTANTLLGAAGGAVAPVAVRGVAKYLPRALGGRGEGEVATRAGKRLTRALGGSSEDVANRLEAPRTGRLTQSVPLTAAQKSGSTELALEEIAARRRFPEHFAELGRRQNEALHDAVLSAGREGTDLRLERLNAVREGRTAPLREDALQKASAFSHVAEPLQQQVNALRTRSAAGTPQRGLADLVERNVAENASPEQLYDLRKLLASKLNGPMVPGDEVAAITKGAQKETMAMIEAIDNRLNEAATRKGTSPTQFSDYLREYQARSGPVESARAQQLINRDVTQMGRPMVGEAPETTRAVLKRALEKHGVSKKFGTKLEPNAQARYGEVMDVMQQMEEPMRSLKLGGTGGGGSQTAMQTGAKAVLNSKVPFAGHAMDMISERFGRATQEEVARMMLDPALAARNIRAALQAGRPLTQGEQAFLMLSRSAGAGVPAALSAQAGTQ